MSEVKRGLFLRVVEPIEWHIHIVKTGKDWCKMSYTEVLERPDDMTRGEFREAFEVTVRATEWAVGKYAHKCDVRYEWEGEDRVKLTVEIEGRRSAITGMVGAEFIGMSKLGDMPLRELMMFAGLGLMTTKEKEGVDGHG